VVECPATLATNMLRACDSLTVMGTGTSGTEAMRMFKVWMQQCIVRKHVLLVA
jgi:hypothetical protein